MRVLIFLVWLAAWPLAAKEVESATKMKALLQFAGTETIDSSEFARAMLEKAKELGNREKVVGWICDSSESKDIPFILDHAGRGFIIRILKPTDGQIYIAHVQFVFDSEKRPIAVYASLQNQGPPEKVEGPTNSQPTPGS